MHKNLSIMSEGKLLFKPNENTQADLSSSILKQSVSGRALSTIIKEAGVPSANIEDQQQVTFDLRQKKYTEILL